MLLHIMLKAKQLKLSLHHKPGLKFTPGLMVFPGPLHVDLNGFMIPEFLQGIKLPAQIFFREFLMNKGMTLTTNIYAPLTHIRFIKVFLKPFIAVAGSGNQMMKSQ